MSTYIVFTREKTLDQNELDTYFSLVAETFEGHPIKPIVAYGAQKSLEGDEPEGIVIVEFPDKASALAWYDGDAYRKVREHRFAGAKYRATLVEGV
ncbi:MULTISPECIES: DUF1330 domain-containing protein [Asaia]|uniref:Uncharacterized conserved protein n=1 Tax=Asaia bogorensis TaxID=91915 RepID=A0A060QLM8_9PROT|nr:MULTISPECIES: DUF1330 domain-containing protein [Asaia]ETC97836.1 hypothetical protein P792_12800 [Asaia sp. SF2.1]MDL2170703.1 DUF1330 domain-containing protein [Asaia sp. HumB]CDG40896.1 Uncharacterized conserved protein [Asaia bogorensis]